MLQRWNREEKAACDLPIDTCLHVVVSVSYVASREDMVKKKRAKYCVDPLQTTVPFSLALGWNEEALFIGASFPHGAPYQSSWPKYRSADAIELFIDTRNMKSVRLLHKYCHQFVLFPEPVEGIVSREVTSFRTQETRARTKENRVRVTTHEGSKEPLCLIEVPREALYGWDPEEQPNIGFALALYTHEGQGLPLSFPFQALPVYRPNFLERIPHQWATCRLAKEL